MELIPTFIERKHGRERVEYLDPRLEPILVRDLRHHGVPGAGDADRAGASAATRSAAPTCCAARWARRSPRRWRSSATSSSKARRRTASPKHKADELFDLMEKFAGYGFNKSHAAAYALVAYQTAYLKAHHAARVHGGQHVGGDGRHRQGAAASTTTRIEQRASTILPPDVNASRLPLRAGRREDASATVSARSRARARRRSTPSSRRATRSGAVHATSSISAAASTSASSTAARSRRWCAPARSMRSNDASREPARLGRHRARKRGAGEPRASTR